MGENALDIIAHDIKRIHRKKKKRFYPVLPAVITVQLW